MGKFTVDDLRAMEVWPQSRVDVARKLTSALGASIGVRVKVDAINELTGEYRIVLRNYGREHYASYPENEKFTDVWLSIK